MPTIKLSLKKSYEKPHIPVEAEVISPDVFVEKIAGRNQTIAHMAWK